MLDNSEKCPSQVPRAHGDISKQLQKWKYDGLQSHQTKTAQIMTNKKLELEGVLAFCFKNDWND